MELYSVHDNYSHSSILAFFLVSVNFRDIFYRRILQEKFNVNCIHIEIKKNRISVHLQCWPRNENDVLREIIIGIYRRERGKKNQPQNNNRKYKTFISKFTLLVNENKKRRKTVCVCIVCVCIYRSMFDWFSRNSNSVICSIVALKLYTFDALLKGAMHCCKQTCNFQINSLTKNLLFWSFRHGTTTCAPFSFSIIFCVCWITVRSNRQKKNKTTVNAVVSII